MFTAHGSVGAPASASPPPHPALLRDEQMDTVGEGVGGGGWRSLERHRETKESRREFSIWPPPLHGNTRRRGVDVSD